MRGSNPRPLAHKTNTLPTELMEQYSWRETKKIVPGGTRTPNPQIRSLMRYPLRHWDNLVDEVFVCVVCSPIERSSQSAVSGRIAQSVERWSNKPLVMGSSPIVTILFVG